MPHRARETSAQSCSCVRVVERKLLRQIKHPLPIPSGSNPQENLHQFQTTEVYGRALRAWPARVQSDNVWREAAALIFHLLLRARGGGPPSPARGAMKNSSIFEERARASFSRTATLGFTSPRSRRLT